MTSQQIYEFLKRDLNGLAEATSQSVDVLQKWASDLRSELARVEFMNVVLAQVLIEKGAITMEELDAKAKSVAEDMALEAEAEEDLPDDSPLEQEDDFSDNVRIFNG